MNFILSKKALSFSRYSDVYRYLHLPSFFTVGWPLCYRSFLKFMMSSIVNKNLINTFPFLLTFEPSSLLMDKIMKNNEQGKFTLSATFFNAKNI